MNIYKVAVDLEVQDTFKVEVDVEVAGSAREDHEVLGVYIRDAQGKRVCIDHLLSDAAMDALIEDALADVLEGGQEFDNEAPSMYGDD